MWYSITQSNVLEPRRTSFWETFFVVQPLFCGILIRNLLFINFPSLNAKKRTHHLFLVEHVMFTIPFALVCFEQPIHDYIYISGGSVILAIGFLIFVIVRSRQNQSTSTQIAQNNRAYDVHSNQTTPDTCVVIPSPSSSETHNITLHRLTVVGEVRALIYIPTVICIFAVDLSHFHKPFAKAVHFGTGLMDVGLGCFILCMAIVGPSTTKYDLITSGGKMRIMMRAARDGLILAAIGAIRVIVMEVFHVKHSLHEYGKHWNVFFSLAFIKIVGTATELIIVKRIPPLLLGVLISIICEGCLETKLKRYLLMNPSSNRDGSFVVSNREGLVSLCGLLSLYLMGMQMGNILFQKRDQSRSYRKTGILLLSFCLSISVTSFILKKYEFIEKESRKMVNIAYNIWMVAYISFSLGIVCLIKHVTDKLVLMKHCDDYRPSSYIEFIDRKGFVYFMLANIVTGILKLLLDYIAWLTQQKHLNLHGCSFLIVFVYTSLVIFITCNFSPFYYCLLRVCKRFKN